MKNARSAAYWIAPSLICLLVHWQAFQSWFRADDFAWLGLGRHVHSFGDLLAVLFSPAAQGTIRPWSERGFFAAGFGLFGLDALPFRLVIFGTQFANLVLVAAIGRRLTGSAAAGFWAAIFWLLNGSQIEPLGWACVYNQVMCACFLLLAFYFLLRSIEAAESKPADPRTATFERLQWLVFLLGFGAQELNMVYPALAATYTYLCARSRFRRTLPMAAVSLVYVLVHSLAAPAEKTGDYAMHFTGAVVRTLAGYWTWSVGPVFLKSPLNLPSWLIGTGVALISVGLLVFLAVKLRGGARAAAFCMAWYLITLAPVLPLRDHMTEYYVYIPLIGICWLGGWAVAEAWRGPARAKLLATGLAALYLFLVVPRTYAGSRWNYRLTVRVRQLVEGVARAHQLHPGKGILLDGVDTDLFWNGILDHPFQVIGIEHVYLTPGSEQHIDAHPDLGDIGEFVLPADVAGKALDRGELVVYDVREPVLRNITTSYAAQPREETLPLRVDAGNSLTTYLLGPEWFPIDGNHRWISKRATLRMGAPAAPGRKLYLHGYCATEQLQAGPLAVTVSVDGASIGVQSIQPGDNSFELEFPLPAAVAGKPAMQVAVEVSRTFRPPSDARDLGLAFGIFEVR